MKIEPNRIDDGFVGFQIADLRLTFSFDNSSARKLFDDGLQPYEILPQSRRGDMHFDVQVSNSLFNTLAQRNSQITQQPIVLSYCTTEAGTVRARIGIDNERCVVMSDEAEFVVDIDRERRNVTIVLTEKYLLVPSWNRDLSKIFQHLVTRHLESRRFVLMHAACVAGNDGRAVLVLGPKRAGKTTLFFELCKRYEFVPLSVDKVWIQLSEDRTVFVYSVPTRLRALAGTLSKYGSEFIDLIPVNYRNSDSSELWLGKSDSKVPIAYARFEAFCGRSFVTSAKLRAICLPNLARDHAQSRTENIELEEAIKALNESLFSPQNAEEDSWLPMPVEHTEVVSSRAQTILAAMATLIPISRLYGSSDLDLAINTLLHSRHIHAQAEPQTDGVVA